MSSRGDIVFNVKNNRAASWSESRVSVGQPVFLRDASSKVVECSAEGNSNIKAKVNAGEAVFYTPTDQAYPVWICVNQQNQQEERVESSLQIDKLGPPENVRSN